MDHSAGGTLLLDCWSCRTAGRVGAGNNNGNYAWNYADGNAVGNDPVRMPVLQWRAYANNAGSNAAGLGMMLVIIMPFQLMLIGIIPLIRNYKDWV